MDINADDMNEDLLNNEGIEFTGGSPMKVDDDDVDGEVDSAVEGAVEEVAEVKEPEEIDDEQDADALDIPYDDSDTTAI